MYQYQCVPSKHGRHQLELTLEYPLNISKKRKNRYHLDLFFFSPYQLEISESRLSRDEFFTNLTSNTRYKSFDISLNELIEDDSDKSPLTRISNILRNSSSPSRDDLDSIIYELRMLANVVQGQNKARRRAIQQMIDEGSSSAETISTAVNLLLDELIAVSNKFRDLEPYLTSSTLTDDIRQCFRWCDELISLRIEKSCVQLHKATQAYTDLNSVSERCKAEAIDQEEYRSRSGHKALLDSDHSTKRDGEFFLYRESQLKKWAESVMYMNTAVGKGVRRLNHILFGIAAAIAMAFAVTASIMAAEYFPPNSLDFAMLAVLAYIFKDRIKEGLRSFFIAILPKIVADRTQYLVDSRGQTRVGKSRERISFPSVQKLPSEVLHARYHRLNPFHKVTPPESIMHYEKDVFIHRAKLNRRHNRLTTINEVVRLDMRQWFYRMDTSESHLRWFDADGEHEMTANRVYHINLVVSLKDGPKGKDGSLYRYRIVANREKILDVDLISSSGN